jgi:hypothetical protein
MLYAPRSDAAGQSRIHSRALAGAEHDQRRLYRIHTGEFHGHVAGNGDLSRRVACNDLRGGNEYGLLTIGSYLSVDVDAGQAATVKVTFGPIVGGARRGRSQ